VIPATIRAATEALVTTSGLGRLEKVKMLPGGANNRVFRLICENRTVVLKSYFRDPGDTRDRLEAEYGFINFAWAHGLNSVAEPIGKDSTAGLALYGALPGRAILSNDVTHEIVRQALTFFLDLNAHRKAKDAEHIHPGSEACFSFAAHIATVNRRMEYLSIIKSDDPLDRDLRAFMAEKLIPYWKILSSHVCEQAVTSGIAADSSLTLDERCLSPSDFGFHNALLDEEGTIRFVDFEYAGWDDPAKMVGDFFNQVAIPVPSIHQSNFTDAVASLSPKPEIALKRINLLMPIYSCKWICIILNDFLPTDARRRRFATSATTDEIKTRKKVQLEKARYRLSRLRDHTN
jgi:hypothetical protein